MGLFLIGLLPTGGMTLAFTGMTGGNMPAAIRISTFSLLLASVLTPFYLQYFMGETVSIDAILITKKILLVIILPLLLAVITRYVITKKSGLDAYKKFKQRAGVFSSVGVLGMVFLVMTMKAESIVENPVKILFYVVPIIIFYSLNYTISTIIGKKFFNKKDALALVFGTSLRHLSIALAIAVTAFGKDGLNIAMIISLAYIFQIGIGVSYVKIADRIFT